jgi:hypothetical protein
MAELCVPCPEPLPAPGALKVMSRPWADAKTVSDKMQIVKIDTAAKPTLVELSDAGSRFMILTVL